MQKIQGEVEKIMDKVQESFKEEFEPSIDKKIKTPELQHLVFCTLKPSARLCIHCVPRPLTLKFFLTDQPNPQPSRREASETGNSQKGTQETQYQLVYIDIGQKV